MSEQGIDAYRVASVLGYCLLPMVGVGAISVVITLEYDHPLRARYLSFLTFSYQRHARLPPLYALRTLVYMVRINNIRRRLAHVRTTAPRRISSRLTLRVLRSA